MEALYTHHVYYTLPNAFAFQMFLFFKRIEFGFSSQCDETHRARFVMQMKTFHTTATVY